ncbi:MAG: hypothetical protein ACKOS8_07315, partial [Gemmataceae bacterium]
MSRSTSRKRLPPMCAAVKGEGELAQVFHLQAILPQHAGAAALDGEVLQRDRVAVLQAAERQRPGVLRQDGLEVEYLGQLPFPLHRRAHRRQPLPA